VKAVPAIRARMGSNTYYETKLTARELTATVRPAREVDKWASASIEERMQRDLNLRRILDEIAPYLAKHPDRLFGSLIILVPQGTLEFEPLTDVVGKLPGAYRSAVESMGFLTAEHGEIVALDGQHRLVALREVITSGDHLGPFQPVVGDDEISVIVVEFESNEKTRRIFNKVNRNAKPTGRSDNILLSEDDGNAIVARMLVDQDAPLAAVEIDGKLQELVNWRSNTLSKRMKELTTISAVYDTVRAILSYYKFKGFDEKTAQVRPPQDDLDRAYDVVSEWWATMLTKVDAFKDALANPDEVTDVRFADDPPYHPQTLLLRPAGQIAMVMGVVEAMTNSIPAGKTYSDAQLTLDEALRRVNLVDWSASPASYWRDVIMLAGGRMLARKEAYTLAASLLAYLIGNEYLDDDQRNKLWERWNDRRGKDVRSTAVEITDPGLRPDPLPDPVK
jgi:DNA sulfur modification protein DndB